MPSVSSNQSTRSTQSTRSPRRRPFVAESIERVPYKTLIPADYNPRHMDPRTLKMLVGSLLRFGWVLPVVINRRTGHIVGGHQRAAANAQAIDRLRRDGEHARAAEYERPPAIFVDVNLATEKALNVALNQISGDWDFFKKVAADQLRQNAAYAQMFRDRLELGRGYRAPLGIISFNFKSPDHRVKFRDFYGHRLLDFGAGGRQEVEWIRKHIWIDAVPFEPFPRIGGKPNLAKSRALADGILGRLERGWRPESVICQFVLSSIGHPDDRGHVLTLLSVLGRVARHVVIAVRSVHEARYQELIGRVRNRKSAFLGIPDATEPGLVVTAAGTSKQKFQKFFTPDELRALLRPFFGDLKRVDLEDRDGALVMVCRKPRRMSESRIRAACNFEFELKIDGKPMGRSARAVAAFLKLAAEG